MKFLLLICFFLQAKVTGQVQVAVEGVRLGMTAEAVIEKLGKDYDLVDTIGKSVAEGDHFYLLYRKKQGDVAVFFRFGRVWTVTGYRFTKGSDAVLSKGDNLQKMFKVLGKPRDAGPGQYLYRCDQVRILIETENGKVTTVTLE